MQTAAFLRGTERGVWYYRTRGSPNAGSKAPPPLESIPLNCKSGTGSSLVSFRHMGSKANPLVSGSPFPILPQLQRRPGIILRACYAMSGTDPVYQPTRAMPCPVLTECIILRACYAMSGTPLAYQPTRVLRDVRY
eukprot:3435600-Rhodomonas_salina.16